MAGVEKPLSPERLGERLSDVYDVVGPLYRRVYRTVERNETRDGVSVGVRAVLDMLRRLGPSTVPQLAREQDLSRQFVQRMVNAGAARGLVRARANPAHKRSSLIELTAAGTRTIDAIRRGERESLGTVGGAITEADVRACLHVLEHMLAVLDPTDD